MYLFDVDGLEFAVAVEDFAVHHGHADVRALCGIDHVARRAGHRGELRRIRVQHAQVSAHADGEQAAVVAALAERARPRCRTEHLSRGDDGRVAEIALVDHTEQVHILHNVQIVVGRRAVRTERDIDAALEHLRHVRIAGGELEVARRAAGNRNAVLFQNVEVAVLKPDAVRRRRRRVEDAVLLHVRRRGQAVAALALLVLGLGFGQMDVDACAGVAGVLRDRLDDFRVGGILAVNAQVAEQTAAVRAVPLAAHT